MNKFILHFLPVLASCLFVLSPARAQEKEQRWNIAAYGGVGYMAHSSGNYQLLTSSFVYPTIDLKMGYHTTGNDPNSFAALFNYPTMGLGVNWKGVSFFNFVGDSRLSDLLALYGFFERDFVRTRRFSFGYDFSAGVGFNGKVYDPEKNPYNTVFNSGILIALGPGITLKCRPARHWEVGLTGRFMHLSTGRLVYPNEGFNGVEVMASVRYAMAQPKVREGKAPKDTLFKKRMQYELYAGYGVHRCSMEWDVFGKTEPWPSYTFGGNACYRYNKRLSSGMGVDVFAFTKEFIQQVAINEKYAAAHINTDDYDYEPVCFGISAIQQVHYGNFTAWMQIGAYVYKHLGVREQEGYTYQRFGGKYVFPKLGNMYLGIACKCHKFSRATSLDFTLGVRI